MNNDELKIIVKIIEFKELKSEHIFYQRYAGAADARDNERVYEWKLLKFLGYEHTSSENVIDREMILNDYFIEKFGTEYPKKINTDFKKNILRQIKLNELGI